MARKRTALVLSGGGSLGAVQVGMLHALSRANFTPDVVIGASVGALNGAFFACDPTPSGVERLTDLWRSLRRKDIFPLTLLAGLTALLFGRDHLIEPFGLRALAHRALEIQRIEQARIPLHIVATDVLSGEEMLLSSGDMEIALMASTAIPVVFPCVEIGGRYLVDGAVSNNTPIAGAVACGAEHIVVLPTGTSCAMQQPPRSMPALALHALNLQNMRQLDRDVGRYTEQVRITLVPPLCPLSASVFDFSQTDSLIQRAANQTRDWLAAGGMEDTGPLHVPLAHHHGPGAVTHPSAPSPGGACDAAL
ncbi:MAG TPA: patatin-like phospholipase family protein [Rhodanobacteraceae bacterium]|nr:patatin-like phospholipase family protein [Rhodanobacteraceae bacterium]